MRRSDTDGRESHDIDTSVTFSSKVERTGRQTGEDLHQIIEEADLYPASQSENIEENVVLRTKSVPT